MHQAPEHLVAGHLSGSLRKIDPIEDGLHMPQGSPKCIVGMAQRRICFASFKSQAGVPSEERALW